MYSYRVCHQKQKHQQYRASNNGKRRAGSGSGVAAIISMKSAAASGEKAISVTSNKRVRRKHNEGDNVAWQKKNETTYQHNGEYEPT